MNDLKERTEEMTEVQSRRRSSRKDRVKTAAIIFLAVMLVFTFFSNTIMNYSLPEVSGQYAGSDTISTSIRGSGTVTANQAYSVQLEEGRRIASVYVKAGDTVEAGQVLFALEDTDSQELKEAKATLQEMEYNYNVALLKALGTDAASDSALAKAEADLAAAQADLAEVAGSGDRVSGAKQAMRNAQDLVDSLTDQVADLNAEIESVQAAAEGGLAENAAITQAQEDLTLAKNAQTMAQAAYDAAQTALTELEQSSGGDPTAKAEAITAAQRALADARLALQRLEAEYDRLLEDQKDYEAAQEAVEAAQADVDRYGSGASGYTQAKEDYEAAQAALGRANPMTQRQVDSLKLAWERAQADYAAGEATDRDAEDARIAYVNALEDLETYEALEADLEEAQRELEGYSEDAEKYAEALESAKEHLAGLEPVTQSQVDQKAREIQDQEISIARQEEDLKQLEQDQTNLTTAGSALAQARERQTQAKETLDNANQNVENAESRLTQAVNAQVKVLEEELREKEAELKAANRSLEDLTEAYTEIQEQAAEEENLEEQIRTLQQTISDTAQQLASQARQSDIDRQVTDLGLEQDALKIEDQKDLVASLEAKSIGTEVISKYAGTISKVNVVSGDKVEAGSELCSLDVEGKGYTLSITVTAEQSRQVHTGDKATVSNYWWGDLDVTLTAIKADRSNPGQSKILEFTVEGDVTDGQTLEISVGEKQTRYDLVVPNSAIREDSKGSFILVATAKATPLATRYTATRVNVTVLAKDSYNTAIDAGTEYGYDYVITTSTKPLEAGSQVRLVES